MKFAAVFSLVMSIIFITFGIIIPFYPPPAFQAWGIKNGMEYIAALLLITYGLFRLSRAIKMLKS